MPIVFSRPENAISRPENGISRPENPQSREEQKTEQKSREEQRRAEHSREQQSRQNGKWKMILSDLTLTDEKRFSELLSANKKGPPVKPEVLDLSFW